MIAFKNCIVLTFLGFCWSLQAWLLIVVGLKPAAMPIGLSNHVYPEWQFLIRPEHDAMLYHVAVGIALSLQAALFIKYRRKLTDLLLLTRMKEWIILEGIVSALLIASVFKQVVNWQSPMLAKGAFYGLIALAILIKVFAAQWQAWFKQWAKIIQRVQPPFFSVYDALVLLAIVVLLFVPDGQGVVARMFIGEQFHHWDGTITATGWAYSKGAILNVDVISQYGIGLPILIVSLTKLLGGFSYEHVFYAMLIVAIVYYLAVYIFLRLWLKNIWLAIAGVLFAIKIQMFHPLAYPFIFTYPSGTVLRYCWDIAFFISMFMVLVQGRGMFLGVAACIAGLSLFHMTTTGMCLSLAFYVALVALMVFPTLRPISFQGVKFWGLSVIAAILPMLTAGLLFYASQGQWLFKEQFWHNMGEFNNYFLSCFGTLPMDDNIKDHNYCGLLMGFVIAGVYVITMSVALGKTIFNKANPSWVLAGLIAFYGAATYHYYISRSMAANAYGIAIPYALLLAFWVSVIIKRFWIHHEQIIGFLLVMVVVWALGTNYLFIAYPNIINMSRNPLVDPLVVNPLPDGRPYFNHLFNQLPMSSRMPVNSVGEVDEHIKTEKDFKNDQDLKAYYLSEFDFSEDAAMIDALVKSGQKAAVVSSFETKILMQADRQPFFYYSPLVISRLMRMRIMVVTALYTSGHLTRTIAQIESQKPEYIFIEKIFNKANMNAVNYTDGSAFRALMAYIHQHYTATQEGKFLMALKRQD